MRKILLLGLILGLGGGFAFAQGTSDDDAPYYRGRGFGPRFGGPWFGGGPGGPWGLASDELFGGENQSGMVIIGVLDDSSAAAAGLQRGDILLSISGQQVNNMLEAIEVLDGLGSASQVQLSVLRGGSTVTLNATLDTREDMPRLGFLGFGQRPELSDIEEHRKGLSRSDYRNRLP